MEYLTQELLTSGIWLIVAIVFLVIEAITVGIVTIWFAVGSLAAFVVAICDGALALQIVVFLVVSLVSLAFTRKIFVQKLKTGKEKTNVDALIGQTALVVAPIGPMKPGTARVKGQEWSAVASNEEDIYSPGQQVVIEKIEGVKLIVSQAQKKGE